MVIQIIRRMPMHDIQIKEYECAWCGYKWINRVNGKDGAIPEKCAKCKRANWFDGNMMTYEEIGLRRRIEGFRRLYSENYDKYHGYHYIGVDWPADLSDKFLSIDNPRPSVRQLNQVMYPLGWNPGKHRYMIPDPDRRGYLKYDSSQWVPDPDNPGKMKYNSDYSTHEYLKLLKQEAQKRIDIMVEIMKSRGLSYSKDDLDAGITKTKEMRKAEHEAIQEVIRPWIEKVREEKEQEQKL